MTARGVVSVALAVAMLPAFAWGIQGSPQVQTGQKPQVVTLLGKSYFARADADGAIGKADAALAADPHHVDLIIAAARAGDVALQFDASIELYKKAIGLAPDDVRAYRLRGHRYISTRRFDPGHQGPREGAGARAIELRRGLSSGARVLPDGCGRSPRCWRPGTRSSSS